LLSCTDPLFIVSFIKAQTLNQSPGNFKSLKKDAKELNITATHEGISFDKAEESRKPKFTYIRIKIYGLKNSKDIILNTKDLSDSGKSFKLQ
jgi:hypothetical protein